MSDYIKNHRAIVIIPEQEMHKLAHGIILPDGYTLVDRLPVVVPMLMGFAFQVESWDLPRTDPAAQAPTLGVLQGYQGIVVERWDKP